METTTNEHAIIGTLLDDRKDLFETTYLIEQLRPEDFLELEPLYAAMKQAYDQDLPLTPHEIGKLSGRSQSELEMMRQMFRDTDANIRRHAHRLIVDTERRRLLDETSQANRLLAREGSDPEPVIQRLGAALKQTRYGQTFKSKVGDIVDEREDEVILSPTRIPVLDRLLNGGMRTKRLIAIGGRQKGRKTTFAREVSLNLLFDVNLKPKKKANIAFLCFENDQWSTTWDFVATLAANILHKQGKLDEKANLLVSEILMEAYPRSRVDTAAPFFSWPIDIQHAVEQAVKLIHEVDLFVYDRSKAGGKLSDVDSVERIIASHLYNNVKAGQHPVFVVDYAQIINHSGDLYNHMSSLSGKCIEWVSEYACTLLCLSQFNEAYNKEAASGVQIDYVGTKGGGDLESACHTYITTGYNSEFPDQLSIHVKRQRRGGTGSFDLYIHPATGHIL